jgi:hypothetical protein
MTPDLDAYLHDHRAGAEAAITLIDRLAELDPARRAWLMRLRGEVETDRAALVEIMRRLQIAERAAAPLSGWTIERLAVFKTAIESPDRLLPLARLEALEALTLGILGKHKLWVTLTAVARDYPQLHEIDFDRLRARAIEQHALLEQERLAAALLALGSRRRSA